MPRLSAVPESPPRAIAYVRVSTARDDMVSPELQLTAIQDHCARAGYRLIETIQDLDLSGRFWKRRQVDRAIGMIEAGDADVLVVWKWSRVSRNRLDWAVAVDRVESAGGKLDSATEPIDTTTSAGRLQRGMLAEFAAFESDRMGDVWREVHARRTSRGLPANGKPRFGYEMVDGLHRPDPKTGPVLASLYRRYIAGESVYGMVEWLNAEGFRTAPGYSKNGPGPWTQMTLRRCLDSGFGAGFILVSGERQRGAHEPVIDEPTWEQYQATRAARRTLRRSERSQYLLSGLMRCMYLLDDGQPCGSSMGGGQFGHNRTPKFRCLAAAAQRRHQGGYVMMRVAERAVTDWLRDQAPKVNEVGEHVQQRSPGPRRQRRDAAALEREILELDRQLVNLTVQLSRGIVPLAAYEAARDQIAGEKGLLEQRHAQEMLAVAHLDAGPLAASLLDDWDGLLVEEKRAILRRLISRVEVVPGRPLSKVTIRPIWAGEKRPES